MALTKAYLEKQEELRKREIKGTISIKDIEPGYLKKRELEGDPVRIGEVTPFTCLKITE